MNKEEQATHRAIQAAAKSLERIADNIDWDNLPRLGKSTLEIRDQFAMSAMEALIGKFTNVLTPEEMAKASYNMADIMVEERSKRKET